MIVDLADHIRDFRGKDVFFYLEQRGVQVEPVASNVNCHGQLKC